LRAKPRTANARLARDHARTVAYERTRDAACRSIRGWMRASARENARPFNRPVISDDIRDSSLDNANTILLDDVNRSVYHIAHAGARECQHYGSRSAVYVRAGENAHRFVYGRAHAFGFCHERDSLRTTKGDPIVAPRIRARLKPTVFATALVLHWSNHKSPDL